MVIESKDIVRSLRGAEAAGEAGAGAPRAFTSKIGRLPEAVRLELNERLQDSVPAREILDWLNALPEAQAVMASQFGGTPVTEDNVSRWRQTGYAAWQAGTATLESLRQLSLFTSGMDDAFQADLNGKLSILMMARFAAELQRYDCMEDGPGKSEAWRSLVTSFLILRRADYYGVKVREDRERAAIEQERARKKAEQDEPLSPEAKRDRMDQILGTGRFECRWDNERKLWVGPGAARRYEEEEVETRVREEMLRRYPNGFPAGYRPPTGGLDRAEPARPGTDEPLPDVEENSPDIVSPAQTATVPPPPHPAR